MKMKDDDDDGRSVVGGGGGERGTGKRHGRTLISMDLERNANVFLHLQECKMCARVHVGCCVRVVCVYRARACALVRVCLPGGEHGLASLTKTFICFRSLLFSTDGH